MRTKFLRIGRRSIWSLTPHHPRHGQTYRLTKPGPSLADEEDALRALEMEDALEGKYVWVHCCQVVMDPEGDLVDVAGRHYRQDFSTVMFCTEFTSFEDVALQCDENFGKGEWDEYELYLDDELPLPVASFG